MANNSSYADFVRDWDRLLTAAEEYKLLLPSIGPHLLAMQQNYDQVKVLKARQDSHQAARQVSTQELGGLMERGRELAIRLRGAIRADLGPKSELLVHFGVAPLRRRTRRSTNGKPTPPPTGNEPAAEPEEPTK